ncbi:MAG: tRNA guanosine(15) transglycosylase TgtA, partial [Candidatus Syntropharchaeia archaeon]
MDAFEIIKKDVMGRIGKLITPSGTIETPAIMPVIHPDGKIGVEEAKKVKADVIMCNAYIIYRKFREEAIEKGIHRLLNWDKPIMTDSGSYQLSVYGGIEVSNAEIVEFEDKIGSDIGVPLDIPTPPDVGKERAEFDGKETLKRLKEAKEIRKRMLIAGTIQGSNFPDLRERFAREVAEIGFDIYPIGGVVPLLENYRYGELVDVIIHAKKGIPPSSPVHLFGAGHPHMFSLAVALGCDLFDSAAYALYARDKRYLTQEKTYHIEDLEYLPCSCSVCSTFSKKEIKEDEKLLGQHNLEVTFEEMRLVKQCIRDGNLWELVERRCRAHPSLLEGLKRMMKYTGWIERYDPVTKGSFFYTGPESSRRTEVVRYSKRLERFDLHGKV